MRQPANYETSPGCWIALVWLLCFALAGGTLYGQEKAASTPPPASDYVGAETCKTCHEDMPTKGFYKTFEESRHYVTTLDTKKGPEWHGCEACHGPGKAHVDGGGNKTKIPAAGAAAATLLWLSPRGEAAVFPHVALVLQPRNPRRSNEAPNSPGQR